MGRPKLPHNLGGCIENHCDEPVHCRGVCRRHYRHLHYEEHERARRGATKTPPLPLGAKRLNADGYVLIKVGFGREWKLEHRLVMEQWLGRELLPGETVHHINGCKTENDLANLELWASTHPKGQRVQDLVEWAEMILKRYGNVR